MKNSEIERLENIRSRLEEERSNIQKNIDSQIDDIKATYGIGLTDEQFEAIWQDKINVEIEKYRRDADKSFITEAEKQNEIDVLKAKYQKIYNEVLEQRKKYLNMTEEEISREIISGNRHKYNAQLIQRVTNNDYNSSKYGIDWSEDKETRTLVGEIKYVEFMNLDQKKRRDYIRNELKNIRSRIFDAIGIGVAPGLFIGFIVAAGNVMALDGNQPPEKFLMQIFSSAAVTSLLSAIVSAFRHSKALSLIRKMQKNKSEEYSGHFEDVIQATHDSHKGSENRRWDDESLLENLNLVNVTQDYTSAEAAKKM